MKALPKMAIAVAAVVGSAFGGLTIAESVAGTDPVPPPVGQENEIVEIDVPDLVAPTTGDEKEIFGEMVASSDNGGSSHTLGDAVLHIHSRAGNGDVCFTMEFVDKRQQGCYSEEVIRAGVAYTASQSHPGDPVFVVGIVPDDVDRVQIDSDEILVVDNVWTYTGDSGQTISPIISSTATGASARLGG